jgi:hypothetical protein
MASSLTRPRTSFLVPARFCSKVKARRSTSGKFRFTRFHSTRARIGTSDAPDAPVAGDSLDIERSKVATCRRCPSVFSRNPLVADVWLPETEISAACPQATRSCADRPKKKEGAPPSPAHTRYVGAQLSSCSKNTPPSAAAVWNVVTESESDRSPRLRDVIECTGMPLSPSQAEGVPGCARGSRSSPVI